MDSNGKMPGGIKYLVGNEAVERYTFYAMRTILFVYMTKYLLNAQGQPAPLSEAEATSVYHLFAATNYFFPILGSILADLLIGKYLTVMSLSVVYVLGCVVLAFNQTTGGLYLGLGLIALGSGGIKPCMVAMVGDQFNKSNQNLLGRAIRYFYISVQVGGFISTLVSPVMLQKFGPKVAFGIPAILMAIAVVIYWSGRNKYVKVPPDFQGFKRDVLTKEGFGVLARISGLLFFMTAFFSLYDQNGSSWVAQAEKMDLNFMGMEWLPAQIQAINPILCIVLTFAFDRWIYKWVDSNIVKLTSLRKIGFGLFLMVVTFLLTARIQQRIDNGETLNISWQLLAWLILTASEVLAYSTAMEFFYTQAPQRMKSLVQGLFLLAVTFGNLFTSAVNWGIENVPSLKALTGATYFVFFAGFMAIMTIAFIMAAVFYKERTYLQDGTVVEGEGASA